MSFDYNVYYRQDCIVPLCLALFAGAVLLHCLIRLVRKLRITDREKRIRECRGFFIALPFFAFLLSVNCIHLFRGGIFLLTEKEEDAVSITGVIEETFEIDFCTGSKYDTEQNSGSGEALVINGTKYYVMTYGDLKTGDTVSATVLPRSKMILEIHNRASDE